MYIDAHTHLDYFKENINEAIKQINENKIMTIAHSMDIESYKKNREFGEKSDYIIPCFGIHPWKAVEYTGDLKDLIPYIEESEMIGEIGLDFHWVEDETTYDAQRKLFKFQLNEGIKRNKVICLHTKGAEEEIYDELKAYDCSKVIIHWYSGEDETLEKLIDLGCYFTISVDIGYSKRSEEVLRKIPMDKLLTETDGPTALEWVNGEYGYPKEVIRVLENISKIKNISIEELEGKIQSNYNRLIN
ncbi:MAG: TatD family hydrolase [Clostridium sp.]